MFTAMAEAWEKMHANCEPVWEEPKPDMASSEDERIFFWMSYGEHGQSSKYMAWKLQNSRTHPYAEPARPYDPDDFGRCHKLLAMVPEFRGRMERMKECGPEWSDLVDHWDELTAMYEAKDEGMYKRVQQLTEPDSAP